MLKPYYNADTVEAGLDEVGRGCLAGPVVAAAVILPKNYTHPVLNDSKQLTRLQRETLRIDIERDAIAWAIAEVSHEDIDRINILKASFLAMHRAVDALAIRPEHLLVDGNRFVPYPMIPHTCIVKGDAHFLSIAAASVLAKTYRDDLMEQLGRVFPAYGWAKNVGYPTPVHRAAIRQFGPTKYHRMSFRLL
ncbi:ribonuclease HII [Spirosoma areae]